MSGTEAAAVVAVACVPDMISSILERVPAPVLLFRCSLVCKEWRGIISDPAFLLRRSMASASLLGIFVQRDRPRKITELFSTIAPVLVPAPGSVLGPQIRFLTSFIRDDAGILDDAHPLAAHDGLLLVRVWRPRRSTDKTSSGGSLIRLCVCNLLTGKHDVLPALDVDAAFDTNGIKGYALLTAADHGPDGSRRCPADGYSTLFQVLLVGRGNSKQLHIHSGHARHLHVCKFSSASGDWVALDCGEATSGLWGPSGYCVAAVARGTARWLYGGYRSFYTLDVCASTGQISLTTLPGDAVAAFIQTARRALRTYNPWCSYQPWWLCTTAEGRLALFCMVTSNRLVIMKQRNNDGDHWDSDHVVEVYVDVDLGFGRESLSPMCIGDRIGTALVRSRSDPERRVYVLDIDLQSSTVSATRMEGWARNFNTMTVAPLEINWATFFVSRLGVKL